MMSTPSADAFWTFEPSKNYVGLQPTIEEVDYEVIPRKKCKQCKCYLSKVTVSIFCLKCSRKRIDIS